MIYELLALYEQYKLHIQNTVNKSWREEYGDYYTLDSFMRWLAEKVNPTQQDKENNV